MERILELALEPFRPTLLIIELDVLRIDENVALTGKMMPL